MNILRMVNVVMLAACSAAAALTFEHGYMLAALVNGLAVAFIMVGLIARLALTSKFE